MGEARAIATTIAGAIAAAGIAWAALANQACSLKNCDGSFFDTVQHPELAPNGTLIDVNTWETSPISGPWISFPPQASILVSYQPLNCPGEFRTITDIEPYISPDESPNDVSNFTLATGNLMEIQHVGDFYLPDGGLGPSNTVVFHNDTCQQWYLRAVFHAAPTRPLDFTCPTLDGGAPLDSGQDAPIDAPSDVNDAGAD